MSIEIIGKPATPRDASRSQMSKDFLGSPYYDSILVHYHHEFMVINQLLDLGKDVGAIARLNTLEPMPFFDSTEKAVFGQVKSSFIQKINALSS